MSRCGAAPRLTRARWHRSGRSLLLMCQIGSKRGCWQNGGDLFPFFSFHPARPPRLFPALQIGHSLEAGDTFAASEGAIPPAVKAIPTRCAASALEPFVPRGNQSLVCGARCRQPPATLCNGCRGSACHVSFIAGILRSLAFQSKSHAKSRVSSSSPARY